jgi:DNA-binding MurR/RpiR family transcriptional regulator
VSGGRPGQGRNDDLADECHEVADHSVQRLGLVRNTERESEIKYFQASLASRITQLAVLDALFVALAMKNKNRTAARLQGSGAQRQSDFDIDDNLKFDTSQVIT